MLQGLEDEVVPPNQATMIVEALKAKGVPVAYIAFEGEQHGFRRQENIRRAIEAELSFYAQVFGFELPPDEGIEPVEIESQACSPSRAVATDPPPLTSRESTTCERVRSTSPSRWSSMISRSRWALSRVRTRAIASASPVTLQASTTSGCDRSVLPDLLEQRPGCEEQLDQRLGASRRKRHGRSPQ